MFPSAVLPDFYEQLLFLYIFAKTYLCIHFSHSTRWEWQVPWLWLREQSTPRQAHPGATPSLPSFLQVPPVRRMDLPQALSSGLAGEEGGGWCLGHLGTTIGQWHLWGPSSLYDPVPRWGGGAAFHGTVWTFYHVQLVTIFVIKKCFKEVNITSQLVQGLRICLLMQVTWVRSLVREDPTCRGSN